MFYDSWKFKHSFRLYQEKAISEALSDISSGDKKLMFVSPPGSGKTLMALELIRSLDKKAVVFAPTKMIVNQWVDKVSLFCDNPEKFASFNEVDEKPVNVLTYQKITYKDNVFDEVESLGKELWFESLAKKFGDVKAKKIVESTKAKNPALYRKNVLNFVDSADLKELTGKVYNFLHKNAKEVIDNLVKKDVKIVVLDESHHLLKYWGIVLNELISRIDNCIVIGLTATYPIQEEKELDVFFQIMDNEIDVEVNSFSVIKEGFLAPYRELVYLTKPLPEELDFLQKFRENQETALNKVLLEDFSKQREEFFLAQNSEETIKDDYALYLAIQKWKSSEQLNFEEKKLVADEFYRFLLNSLKSDELKDLNRFLISRNVRPSNNSLNFLEKIPYGLLGYSKSKVDAAKNILKAEFAEVKEKLRAIAVCDFESFNPFSGTLLKDFDKKSGSAYYIFSSFVSDPEIKNLRPVLITSNVLATSSDDVVKEFKARLGKKVEFSKKANGIIEIVPVKIKRNELYLDATKIFDSGKSMLIIGTKGLLGEGWDSLSANTLIDLTNISYGVSVQQLRGRTMRLDPNNPEKLSNNWDIAVLQPNFLGELNDLEQKHGLIFSPDEQGFLCSGLGHFPNEISNLEKFGVAGLLDVEKKTVFYASMALANDSVFKNYINRQKSRELWKIGEKIEGKIVNVAEYVLSKKKYVPLFGHKQLKTALIIASIGFLFTALFINWFYAFIAFFGFLIVSFIVTAFYFTFYSASNELFISKIAKVLLKAMVASDLLAAKYSDSISINVKGEGVSVVFYGDEKSAKLFLTALDEMLVYPKKSPRYLITNNVAFSSSILVKIFMSPVFLQQYLNKELSLVMVVPSVFSRNKELVEAFVKEWNSEFGEVEVFFAKSREGMEKFNRLSGYRVSIISLTRKFLKIFSPGSLEKMK